MIEILGFLKKLVHFCSCPGLNRRPSACKADVITTTPHEQTQTRCSTSKSIYFKKNIKKEAILQFKIRLVSLELNDRWEERSIREKNRRAVSCVGCVRGLVGFEKDLFEWICKRIPKRIAGIDLRSVVDAHWIRRRQSTRSPLRESSKSDRS